MKIALYVLAGFQVLEALLVIARIGKPRPAVTRTAAIVVVIASALITWLLVMAAGRVTG